MMKQHLGTEAYFQCEGDILRQELFSTPYEEVCYDYLLNHKLRLESISKYIRSGATYDIRELILTPYEVNLLINQLLRENFVAEYGNAVSNHQVISAVCDSNFSVPLSVPDMDVYFESLSVYLAAQTQQLYPLELDSNEIARNMIESTDRTLHDLKISQEEFNEKMHADENECSEREKQLEQRRQRFEEQEKNYSAYVEALHQESQATSKMSQLESQRAKHLQALEQSVEYHLDKLKSQYASERERMETIENYITVEIPKEVSKLDKERVFGLEEIREYQEKKHMVLNEHAEYQIKMEELEQESTDYMKKQEKREEKIVTVEQEFQTKMESLERDASESIERYMQGYNEASDVAENLKRSQRDIEALMARNVKLNQEIDKLRVKIK